MSGSREKNRKKTLSLQRISYRIRVTRAALSPDRMYNRQMRDRQKPFTSYDEFGFSSNKTPIMGRYVWLLGKLAVLYLVKLVLQACRGPQGSTS